MSSEVARADLRKLMRFLRIPQMADQVFVPGRARSCSLHGLDPVIDLALGLILGVAVALLQTTGELGALALDDIQIVVGELAPFLLGLTLELFPVTFDAIPIHVESPIRRLILDAVLRV